MTMTTASVLAPAHDGVVDEPEPAARARRRTSPPSTRSRSFAEYDPLPTGSPGRCALLRREGLHSSHIAEWRKACVGGCCRSPERVELERLLR